MNDDTIGTGYNDLIEVITRGSVVTENMKIVDFLKNKFENHYVAYFEKHAFFLNLDAICGTAASNLEDDDSIVTLLLNTPLRHKRIVRFSDFENIKSLLEERGRYDILMKIS
jgi:hypothetical protein